MSFLPSALPWQGVAAFPALLAFISVLLFSTATLAFYVKQRISFGRLQSVFARIPGLQGNAVAAGLGAATPFCTCTAVPLFLGMLEVDVPIGPAVSFLLASPTINLGAVIVLLVVFGWRVALFYAGACLFASVLVGWIMGRIPREQALRDFFWIQEDDATAPSRRAAVTRATTLARRLTRALLPWLVLATATGIVVDALVPTSMVAHVSGWGTAFAVPVTVILGTFIYADILLLIPIGYALTQHGAPESLVLTFMLAASGISLPEMVVLGRVMQRTPALAFIGATILTYMAVGFGLTGMAV